MKRNRLIVLAVLTTITMGVLLVGCEGEDIKSSNKNSSQEVNAISTDKVVKNVDLLKTLNNAKEIIIKKAYYSFGAEYSLYVENQLVGKVKGDAIKLQGVGDTFKMIDLNGNTVKQEKEVPKWGRLNRLAVISTPDGKTTGYIGEEYWEDLFEYGYKFHIYDKDKKEIGYTKQNLTLVKEEFEVFDMEGNEDYDIEKQMFELTPTYKMKVKDNSNMSVEDVVFFVTIQDAIMSAVNDTQNVDKIMKTVKETGKAVGATGTILNTKANTSKTNKKDVNTNTNKNDKSKLDLNKTENKTSDKNKLDLNKTPDKNKTLDLNKTPDKNKTPNNKPTSNKSGSNSTKSSSSSSSSKSSSSSSSSKSSSSKSSSSSSKSSSSSSKSKK